MCRTCDSYNVPVTCKACGARLHATLEHAASEWTGGVLVCKDARSCQARVTEKRNAAPGE